MKRRNKLWTRDETKIFLSFYSARKAEFTQAKKRRLAYAKVREDMVSAGFDSSITVHQLEIKMQTLMSAYKSAKDNASAAGASPCIPPFCDEMDEIFQDKPILSQSKSFNVCDLDAPVSLLTSKNAPSSSSAFFLSELVPTDAHGCSTTSDEATSPSPSSSSLLRKKRNMSRSDYYKESLRLRQEESKAAEARFQKWYEQKQEALKQKEERHRQKCELFKEYLKNKI